jgi:hemolysin III
MRPLSDTAPPSTTTSLGIPTGTVPELAVAITGQLRESLADAKPHLRGWLHLGIVPLTLAAGVVLVVLSPNSVTRASSAVFMASALVLFGVSAAYHRGTWSPGTWRVLRRLDHCNIFVLIAGSSTAAALLLLDGTDRTLMVVLVWSSAALGVAARFVWPDAPRWLSPPVYIACGLGAVIFFPDLVDGASRLGAVGETALLLLGAGAALYIAGAVVYGLRRPDPWPRWFGFHEVFHTFTVFAFASHYVGISLATYAMR